MEKYYTYNAGSPSKYRCGWESSTMMTNNANNNSTSDNHDHNNDNNHNRNCDHDQGSRVWINRAQDHDMFFFFSFFVLNTLLINIYRWTAVAQAINHHYHPKTMKGAQDADMSRAQVCIFFFLSFF